MPREGPTAKLQTTAASATCCSCSLILFFGSSHAHHRPVFAAHKDLIACGGQAIEHGRRIQSTREALFAVRPRMNRQDTARASFQILPVVLLVGSVLYSDNAQVLAAGHHRQGSERNGLAPAIQRDALPSSSTTYLCHGVWMARRPRFDCRTSCWRRACTPFPPREQRLPCSFPRRRTLKSLLRRRPFLCPVSSTSM